MICLDITGNYGGFDDGVSYFIDDVDPLFEMSVIICWALTSMIKDGLVMLEFIVGFGLVSNYGDIIKSSIWFEEEWWSSLSYQCFLI